MVRCTSYFGTSVLVERNRLSFRPASYALMEVDGHVLLETHPRTGRYFFPGTGVAPGDRVEDILVAHLRGEAGLPVRVLRLMHFKESFSWFDPLDAAYHNLSFFWLCEPTTLHPPPELEAQARDPGRFHWVEAGSLTPEHFHTFGHEIFRAWREEG